MNFSPDGSRVAVGIGLRDDQNIFIFDLSSSRLHQLTFQGGLRRGNPVWTPDGKQITFVKDDAIWTIASDFSGDAQELIASTEVYRDPAPCSWSPDGRILLFAYRDSVGGDWDLAQLTRLEEGGVEVGPLLDEEENYNQSWAQFSPDGKWIAFHSDETGATEAYLQRYPTDREAKRRITYDGGEYPIWRREGRELMYLDDGQIWSVEIDTEPRLAWRDPVSVYQLPNALIGYAVSPDSEQALYPILLHEMEAEEGESRPREIRVVLNWFEELKEKVPIP